jgi:hypothetical protein
MQSTVFFSIEDIEPSLAVVMMMMKTEYEEKTEIVIRMIPRRKFDEMSVCCCSFDYHLP